MPKTKKAKTVTFTNVHELIPVYINNSVEFSEGDVLVIYPQNHQNTTDSILDIFNTITNNQINHYAENHDWLNMLYNSTNITIIPLKDSGDELINKLSTIPETYIQLYQNGKLKTDNTQTTKNQTKKITNPN